MDNDSAISVLKIVERKIDEVEAARDSLLPLCRCGCQHDQYDRLDAQYKLLVSICDEWINLPRSKK